MGCVGLTLVLRVADIPPRACSKSGQRTSLNFCRQFLRVWGPPSRQAHQSGAVCPWNVDKPRAVPRLGLIDAVAGGGCVTTALSSVWGRKGLLPATGNKALSQATKNCHSRALSVTKSIPPGGAIGNWHTHTHTHTHRGRGWGRGAHRQQRDADSSGDWPRDRAGCDLTSEEGWTQPPPPPAKRMRCTPPGAARHGRAGTKVT